MYCLFRFEYFAVTLIEYLVMQFLAIVIPGGYVRKMHLSSPKNYFLFSSLRYLKHRKESPLIPKSHT